MAVLVGKKIDSELDKIVVPDSSLSVGVVTLGVILEVKRVVGDETTKREFVVAIVVS